jgi:hypothetical protein
VEVYQETPDWERRQRGVLEGMLAAREAVVAEEGPEAADRQAASWTIQLENLSHMRRRVLVVARQDPPGGA